MIKHIVLFKFKADLPEAEKVLKMQSIKTGLEALIKKTETLKKIEVGINCNQDEKYDLSLSAEFDSMEGLNAYAVHPEHLKIGKIIREILDERACVDYEII
jgi:hypothetical protein